MEQKSIETMTEEELNKTLLMVSELQEMINSPEYRKMIYTINKRPRKKSGRKLKKPTDAALQQAPVNNFGGWK